MFVERPGRDRIGQISCAWKADVKGRLSNGSLNSKLICTKSPYQAMQTTSIYPLSILYPLPFHVLFPPLSPPKHPPTLPSPPSPHRPTPSLGLNRLNPFPTRLNPLLTIPPGSSPLPVRYGAGVTVPAPLLSPTPLLPPPPDRGWEADSPASLAHAVTRSRLCTRRASSRASSSLLASEAASSMAMKFSSDWAEPRWPLLARVRGEVGMGMAGFAVVVGLGMEGAVVGCWLVGTS